MESDRRIYTKEHGRFVPIGLSFNRDWLSDGLWYVKSSNHCTHYANCDYLQGLCKVSNFDQPLPIIDCCNIENIVNKIFDELDIFSLMKCENMSVNDSLHKIVSFVYNEIVNHGTR